MSRLVEVAPRRYVKMCMSRSMFKSYSKGVCQREYVLIYIKEVGDMSKYECPKKYVRGYVNGVCQSEMSK